MNDLGAMFVGFFIAGLLSGAMRALLAMAWK